MHEGAKGDVLSRPNPKAINSTGFLHYQLVPGPTAKHIKQLRDNASENEDKTGSGHTLPEFLGNGRHENLLQMLNGIQPEKDHNRFKITQGRHIQNRDKQAGRLHHIQPDFQLSILFTSRRGIEVRANSNPIKLHGTLKHNGRTGKRRSRTDRNAHIGQANETERNTEGDKPGQKRKDSKVKSKQHVHIDYGNWRDSPHHHNRHQWGGLLVYRHEKGRREIRQLLDKQFP